MCLNAWGWSLQLKHVVHVDKTKFVVVDGSTYIGLNVIYQNGMNFTKILIK